MSMMLIVCLERIISKIQFSLKDSEIVSLPSRTPEATMILGFVVTDFIK